jgi:hypothetical protein
MDVLDEFLKKYDKDLIDEMAELDRNPTVRKEFEAAAFKWWENARPPSNAWEGYKLAVLWAQASDDKQKG